MFNQNKLINGLIIILIIISLIISIYVLINNSGKGSPSPHGPTPPSPTPPSPGPGPPSPTGNTYTLVNKSTGKQIIPENSKGFWTYDAVNLIDTTTHGLVTYVGADKSAKNFEGSTDDKLKIKLNNIPGKSINSIRLKTTMTFDSGLFIIDLNQIPYGKYVWPSFWLLGDYEGNAWSYNGEIDIIEGGWQKGGGINAKNQSTLHTNTKTGSKPCVQTGIVNLKPYEGSDYCSYNPNYTGQDQAKIYGPIPGPKGCVGSGTKEHPDCCGQNKNQICPFNGCGYVYSSATSYGISFQNNGGGVYACELLDDGNLNIWFWSRDNHKIPVNLSDTIDISNWNITATEKINYKPCPNTFSKMRMIINTTIGGDAFTGTGNRDSCNPNSICANEVYGLVQQPNYIKEATWDINYISVYTKKI